ncbi:DNA cytosine methyltransferase [Clostridium magnum]|uniref:DNA (cytosine-5-)-methyltransferase n=1 Tax=Clostridium magnum DSM 2767 TaxID=1121326 RepID=A0A162QLQ7_9CLOT|nr:DNA cytosine methyltransferase [Clostridium magnum]KZL88684.1 modification methylase BspRI [Clostridium magnum DSM 2767]
MSQLSIFDEVIVDNFAGGGGASTGMELATGYSVYIAINHDPEAIKMHKTNHPTTKHYCESVWDVDIRKAVQGRPVGLAWFSPDCKHFSKAKGGKPVEKKVRGLAWVAIKWAGTVRPRVIILENVEEFQTWGPIDNGKPIEKEKGRTFKSFINAFKHLGYKVKYKELVAADYGAPTTRKRFFLIARCDGKPIKWPESTHGEGKLPYVPASSIIDWSIPVPSIFNRKKPLVENTLIRIARGIQKYVIEDEPYVINDTAYFLSHYYTHQGTETRCSSLREPIATIPTQNRFGLVSVKLQDIKLPMKDSVYAFLTKYYGSDTGQSLNGPIHTITTKDRFGLVVVRGKDYKIADVGLRMLTARELFNGMGFPKNYIIDHDYTGKKYPTTQQKARCGNAVVPTLAKVLVEANTPELCKDKVREAI